MIKKTICLSLILLSQKTSCSELMGRATTGGLLLAASTMYVYVTKKMCEQLYKKTKHEAPQIKKTIKDFKKIKTTKEPAGKQQLETTRKNIHKLAKSSTVAAAYLGFAIYCGGHAIFCALQGIKCLAGK